MIGRPARELLQALEARWVAGTGLPPLVCDVCECAMTDVVEHLQSASHWAILRVRMKGYAPDPGRLHSGPWVQKTFVTTSGMGLPVAFNHLTGTIEPQDEVEHEC